MTEVPLTGKGLSAADRAVTSLQPKTTAGRRKIVACIDGSSRSNVVLAHTLALADALDAEITLLRIVPAASPTLSETLPDPVAWDERVRSAHQHLELLAGKHGARGENIATVVVEGDPADQIRRWVTEHTVDLTVFGTHGMGAVILRGPGGTARKLIDSVPGWFALIPSADSNAVALPYRTIVVPLDGSLTAESVLPFAAQLVRGKDAKLIVAHVVPVPELTEAGPLEPEAQALSDQLIARNLRIGTAYLEHIRSELSEIPVHAITLVDDIRAGLVRIIAEQRPDLVIASAYGRTRRADVPMGTVASYLIRYAGAALLLFRGPQAPPSTHETDMPIRLPLQSNR